MTTRPPDPAHVRIERAVIHGTERLALYVLLQSARLWGLITGRGIPS